MKFFTKKFNKKSKNIPYFATIIILLSLGHVFLTGLNDETTNQSIFDDNSSLEDYDSIKSEFNGLSLSRINSIPAWGPIPVDDYPFDDNWIGDINNDSLNDIVIPTHLDNVANVFYQRPNNSWSETFDHTLDIGFNGYSAAFGDLNNDSLTDVLTRAQDNIRIYFQNDDGSGISSTYNLSMSYSGEGFLRILDCNQDGLNDFVVDSWWADNIKIYIQGPVGSFSDALTISSITDPQQIEIADFNNDLLEDFAVISSTSEDIHIFFQKQTGLFNLTADRIISTPMTDMWIYLDIADLNHDNWQDIVTTEDTYDTVLVYLNQMGNFSSIPTQNLSSSGIIQWLELGDLNDDDNFDIVVGGTGRTEFEIYLGFGNGQFDSTPYQTISRSLDQGVFCVGDLNGDGMDDIIVDELHTSDPVNRLIWYYQQVEDIEGPLIKMHSPGYNFSTPEKIYDSSTVLKNGIVAIDSNDDLHLVYEDQETTNNYEIRMLSRINGVWNTPENLTEDITTDEWVVSPSIFIDSHDYKYISYVKQPATETFDLYTINNSEGGWSERRIFYQPSERHQNAWTESSPDNFIRIFVQRMGTLQTELMASTWDGTSWSTPEQLTSFVSGYCSGAIYPSIYTIDGISYIVFNRMESTDANHELYIMNNSGGSWNSPMALTNSPNSGYQEGPNMPWFIKANNGEIIGVYVNQSATHLDLYFGKIKNNQLVDTKIIYSKSTSSEYEVRSPSLVQDSNGNVYITFILKESDTDFDIYMMKSHFNITISSSDTYNINCTITDPSGVKNATLYYGYSTPFNQYSISGVNIQDSLWQFTIPPQGDENKGKILKFYVEAYDNDYSPAYSIDNNSGIFYSIEILGGFGPFFLSPFIIDDTGGGDYTWVQAAAEDWCYGSGTFSNPYVIKNVEIDAGNSGNCLEVRNSNVYFIIQNCTFKNSGSGPQDAGIELDKVNNSQIIDNFISYCYHGISLFFENYNNTIMGNVVHHSNDNGIRLLESDSNYVLNNTVYNNFNGIYLDGSSKNKIIHNNASENSHSGFEIGGYGGNHNTFQMNFAKENSVYGIWVRGINNTVSYNMVNENDYGISTYSGSMTKTEGKIIGNLIFYNDIYGLYLDSTTSNHLVYLNNFTGNSENARDDGSNNNWDNGTIGNYWHDYGGVDANDDGIGDSPYIISGTTGSQDNFPIWRDLEGPQITSVSFNTSVLSNETLIVSSIISDPNGVKNATLYYGYSTPYNTFSILGTDLGGDNWEFIIPSQGESNEGNFLRFFIEAYNNDTIPVFSINDNGGLYFSVIILDDDIGVPTIGTPTFDNSVMENETLTVSCIITDLDGILNATLYYGYVSPYNSYYAIGSTTGGDNWQFVIPAQGDSYEGYHLYFWILAYDNDVTPHFSINDNGGSYYLVNITDSDLLGPIILAPTFATPVLNSDAIYVVCDILDVSGIQNATLFYGYLSPYNDYSISGMNIGGNSWEFVIPAQVLVSVKSTLKFSITAFDSDSSPVSTTNDNLGNYYSVTIYPPLGTFILSSDAGNPDTDGAFNLIWMTCLGADNYSIYRSNQPISQIDGTCILIYDGTTSLTYPITDLDSGDHYFIVVAKNVLEERLSNCLYVRVEISGDGGDEFIPGYPTLYLLLMTGIAIFFTAKLYKRRIK